MGNWSITIEGIGAHHNKDNPGDIDKLAKEFVHKLQQHQRIIHATLTYGSAEPLRSEQERL